MAYDSSQKKTLRRGFDVADDLSRRAFKKTTSNSPVAEQPVAQPAAQPAAAPLQDEASAARDRIRMQISTEQQRMLRDRHARGGSYGDGSDRDQLNRISGMRQELAGYQDAARPGQRPNSPEKNFFASRDASNQAARIMQNDLATMESRVYAMPAGPQRDAAVENLRAFKSKTNEQFVAGNTLRPQDVGPRVPGDDPSKYADATVRADQQTASQVASAGRDYDRRQNVLGYTKELTNKRLLGEAQTKEMQDTVRGATISAIRQPEMEFKARQDQIATERSLAQQKLDIAKATADEGIESSRFGRNPESPDNRLKIAQADAAAQELKRRASLNAGQGGPMNAQEIEDARARTQYGSERAGVTPESESVAMQAANALVSEMGGTSGTDYVGSLWKGNAEGGKKAVSQISNYANSLRDLAQSDPQAARIKAREFLSGLPGITGANRGEISSLASTGLAAGGAAAAPFTMGISLLASIGGVAMAEAQRNNQPDREMVVNKLNEARMILAQLAGQ